MAATPAMTSLIRGGQGHRGCSHREYPVAPPRRDRRHAKVNNVRTPPVKQVESLFLTPIRTARKVEMIDGLVEWAGEVVMSASNGASSTKGTTSLRPPRVVIRKPLRFMPRRGSRSV